MVDVSVDGDRAVFQVEGFDKLWALRSRLEIPLAHITGVMIDPEQARGWWHGFRLMGTNMPGALAAGTFYFHGDLVSHCTTPAIRRSVHRQRKSRCAVVLSARNLFTSASRQNLGRG